MPKIHFSQILVSFGVCAGGQIFAYRSRKQEELQKQYGPCSPELLDFLEFSKLQWQAKLHLPFVSFTFRHTLTLLLPLPLNFPF